MFSLGAWTVVLRLCLGEDTSTSTFGESLASWITLVGMVMVYVGYSFGMSQVIKANYRCPLERYTAVFTKYFTLFSMLKVCFVMPSELFPSKWRATGIGLLNFTNSFTTVLAVQAFPFLIQPVGVALPFGIFGTMSLISALLMWKYVPETREKSLQDIEQFYRSKNTSVNKNEE